jgi:iron(III) transport system ATP-binding protein
VEQEHIAVESGVRLEQVRKRYPTGRKGFARGAEDVTFDVAEGRMFALLGPSGCGKTTTLRCIAGLERPDAGEIELAGRTVFSAGHGRFVATHDRPIGMVFQSYAVWPHMTVFDNVAWPLGGGPAKLTRAEVAERVESALGMVRLDGLEGRQATDLSGGQQQRVALARAIVREPKVLLLDEPLSNLDANLRERMRVEIRNLQRKLNLTCVLVTHDQTEALSMAHRVAVMRDGVIVQQGRPRDVYERPADRFVAEFVGTANIIECTVESTSDDQVRLRWNGVELAVAAPTGSVVPGGRCAVVIRPESLTVRPAAEPAGNTFKGRVETVVYSGDRIDAWLDADGTPIRARLHPSVRLRRGQVVCLHVDPAACGLLPAPAGDEPNPSAR